MSNITTLPSDIAGFRFKEYNLQHNNMVDSRIVSIDLSDVYDYYVDNVETKFTDIHINNDTRIFKFIIDTFFLYMASENVKSINKDMNTKKLAETIAYDYGVDHLDYYTYSGIEELSYGKLYEFLYKEKIPFTVPTEDRFTDELTELGMYRDSEIGYEEYDVDEYTEETYISFVCHHFLTDVVELFIQKLANAFVNIHNTEYIPLPVRWSTYIFRPEVMNSNKYDEIKKEYVFSTKLELYLVMLSYHDVKNLEIETLL